MIYLKKTRILYGAFILMLIFCRVPVQSQDIAEYRVVTHTSSIDQDHCGHLVVDGSMETYWESHDKRDKSPALTIDLESQKQIGNIVINWRYNPATKLELELLNEAETKSLKTFQKSIANDTKTIVEIGGIQARYLKLNFSGISNSVRGCVINEVEVNGKGKNRYYSSKVSLISGNNLSLNGDKWRVQNVSLVKEDIEEIVSANYDDTKWIPVRVPGTVLEAYYTFGALPDPLYGDNMHQISDAFFSGNNFWYRTKVRFNEKEKSQRFFLNFSGINWKSEIYFNGKYLGRIDGAYHRGEFEVTDHINWNQDNTVLVLVYHPDHWVSGTAKVISKTLGCRTTNGDNLGFDSPTCLASAGWNWLPIIKGRNIGIWNDVYFRRGNNVSINDPWVSAILPLPDTTKADLTIRTTLKNHSLKTVKGKLLAEFDKLKIEYPVSLLPNEEKQVSFDKHDFPKLQINNPKLWWPNGYGQQNLTDLNLQFVEDDQISDEKTITFGIRQLDYKVVDQVLTVYCNGYKILLRGGNWGLPEAMMRCDSAGYDLRVKLHKDAHFNMIRNWLGMTGHEEFYKACDRYGILIFDDFWLANPNDGPNPDNFIMFMDNVRDKIKWVRKHPSLALYCGRNEGLPLLEYDTAMKQETELLDGTRHYISHSAAGTVTGLGPYDVQDINWYFANRGKTFHTELGIIAIPEKESIQKMMPEKYWWPISNMWAIHDYQFDRSFKFTDRLNNRYGEAAGVEDYCEKAQLLNYESAKAMFECLQSNQSSGLLLWMSQSAWPSLICQLYDHYFEYTSAFFAAKKACSQIHVFYDPLQNLIRAANNTKSEIMDARLNATIFNKNGEKQWEQSMVSDLAIAEATTFFELAFKSREEVEFLKLELRNKEGKLLNDNFYWLENKQGDCKDLNSLPQAEVSMDIVSKSQDKVFTAEITLKNGSNSVSLLNKLKLKEKETGESILPVFFDDDYISLLPHEEKIIRLQVDKKLIKNRKVELQLEGWNTKTAKLPLE